MNNHLQSAIWFAMLVVLESGVVIAEEQVQFLKQGWTDQERQTYYHLEQGSQLMPLKWILALEEPFSRKPFLNNNQLAKLRLLPDKLSESNPDGLPVGFAKMVDHQQEAWVGLSCAACHTSQLQYQGNTIRVEGGQGLIEFAEIIDTVIAALERTWRDNQRHERFAKKVLGENYSSDSSEALRIRVRGHWQHLSDLSGRSRPAHPAGWGRMDAYNVLFNEFLGTALNEPRNYRVPFSPSSLPSIWLTPQIEFCTYNASIHDLMARDSAEVAGNFGYVKVSGSEPKEFKFESSGTAKAFFKIQMLLQKLEPPVWPEDILGKIDREKAQRGALIYRREQCNSCHWEKPPYPMTEPNALGRRFIKVTRTPVEDVGTDPLMTNNFVERTALTGKFKPLMGDREEVPAWQLFVQILTGVVKNKLAALDQSPAELQKYTYERLPKFPPVDELRAYIAEPLAGIWSTPPYLHNGSVPSLYHLLLPVEQRPKQFFLGTREFDPHHIGYVSKQELDSFKFETAIPGNSNAGHEYGTNISESERMDLLEYLKTF